MKKILFTINYLTNGGPTRVLQNIIKELDKNEYEIFVLTLIDQNNKDLVKGLKIDGIKIIEFNYPKSLKEVIKNRKTVVKKINEINPDIIHTHGIVTTFICANKSINNYKITTIHNSIFEDYKYTYGKLKGIMFALLHILALKRFDDIICCSKTSYNVMKKYRKNATFIRNGIDIDNKKEKSITREKIRKELKIPNDAIVYLYVGVINERKRVVELVDLFNSCIKDNEYLVIVGNGNLMNEAEIHAKSKNIIFTGFKENSIDYYMASDVYVSNSSSEGFSISVIEALDNGLLLLLSDIPSHKECFEIDDNYYIGEYFSKDNFFEKKDTVYENIGKCIDIEKFKYKYLSARSMTDEYKKYYCRGEKR